ncbi:uncharacterized protein BXZ73DRAFT_106252 [Epithele typhae]|uniref:uncharacterized protein n=1 Tax=Epithele typhae TaxID=378194 RepID=UPI002008A00D|nr:uncharacterized protein BXZ73DRAFT_106252 [Epithele typhae]KAH9915280.1 hypothetical protein BXZ73DRAFT_106252 [Epithele typhae]
MARELLQGLHKEQTPFLVNLTMLARVPAFSTFAFACLAAAQASGNCNASEASSAATLTFVGVILQDTTAWISFGCPSASAVSLACGSACEAESVCCENNDVTRGLVSIGCLTVSS